MKERPRAIAALIAVFLFGCLVGAGGAAIWLKKASVPEQGRMDFREGPMKNGPMPRPEPMNFRELLQLTPEQDEAFKQILGESRRKMTEFRKETDEFHRGQDARIQDIITEMNRRLNAVLDEGQKKKFASWQKEFENRRRHPPRRRDFPPPPE